MPAPQLKSDTPPFIESDIYIHHSIQNHHLIMTIVPHILQPAMSTLVCHETFLHTTDVLKCLPLPPSPRCTLSLSVGHIAQDIP